LGGAVSVTVWGIGDLPLNFHPAAIRASAVAYRNFLTSPGFAGEPMSDVSRNEESRHGRRRHIGSHAREAFGAKGEHASRLRQPVAWSWLGGEMGARLSVATSPTVAAN
jgi:hypothetical protein